MKKTKQKKNKISGFSLVEMVIVVAISAIIALAASQTFLAGMKTSEKNKEMQKQLEEARSAMEMMAKNIRMSQYTRRVTSGYPRIFMYNASQGKCISYCFTNGGSIQVLQYAECEPTKDSEGKITGADAGNACYGSTSCSYPSYTSLTTGKNTTGDFLVTPTVRTIGREDERAIGKVSVRMTVGDDGTDTAETLQTTVSFRDYDDILQ